MERWCHPGVLSMLPRGRGAAPHTLDQLQCRCGCDACTGCAAHAPHNPSVVCLLPLGREMHPTSQGELSYAQGTTPAPCASCAGWRVLRALG